MKILFILHAPFELPGFIESWASGKGFKMSYVSPFAGESLLKYNNTIDLIVSMGGPQSAALDLSNYTYLNEEVVLIRNALKASIPVLGFCLGAQLIGEALGARTERSPYKEIGIYPITLTQEGACDPLLQGLPNTFLVPHWHGDMPGLTKEAKILAASSGCPRQIIRYLPHAYGFQCHPEMTRQTAQELITHCQEDFNPGKYVQAPEEILAHDFYELNHEHMTGILNNFLQLMHNISKKPAGVCLSHEK
jgi:GMP synthase (glutamine-hydrolysing)